MANRTIQQARSPPGADSSTRADWAGTPKTTGARRELGKRIRSLQFYEHVLSSLDFDWSGFRLDVYRLPPNARLENTYVGNAAVSLVTGGRARARIRAGGATLDVIAKPGRICILGPGYEMKAVSWTGAHEVAHVEVGGPLLGALMNDRSGSRGLRLLTRHCITDPQVQVLIGNMRAELLAGCPTGIMYAESLSLALLASILNRYVDPGFDGKRRPPQLSQSQRRLVREYIQANLASNLNLSALATVVHRSPYHFSRLFKKTFGITPHQYILRERIDESRRLLRSRTASIVEIALSLGFASQSHFTDVFRKVTGTTPKREQRGWLDASSLIAQSPQASQHLEESASPQLSAVSPETRTSGA
jgi:AraC family transcriptional regulator